MGNELSPTNPGLTYDPRLRSTAKFFEALQKELGRMQKAIGKPVLQSHRSKPVADPGPATMLAMPNKAKTNKVFGR